MYLFSALPLSLTLTLILTLPTSALPQATSSQDAVNAAYSNLTSFRENVINATDTYRARYNASRIQWNDTLTAFAEDVVDDCKFAHSGGAYGENLGAGYESAGKAVEAWGNESGRYDFGAGEFGEETGHFTQLVWRNTTDVGCARKECNGDGGDEAPGWFVVCEYWPRGNVIGQFKDNVQASGQEGAASVVRAGWGVIGVALVLGVVWV